MTDQVLTIDCPAVCATCGRELAHCYIKCDAGNYVEVEPCIVCAELAALRRTRDHYDRRIKHLEKQVAND